MTDAEKNKDIELSKRFIQSLDKLLATGDWEASSFLKTAKKRLDSLRDEAQHLADELGSGTVKIQQQIDSSLKEGYIKVYIFLYQAEGGSIAIWQNMLKSLAKYSITRPVYIDEAHVREVVRSKTDAQKHAYVVVAIKETDIIHLPKASLDQFGHELLTLKEGAVQLDNIIEFVHANKKHYLFHNNTLILKDTVQ